METKRDNTIKVEVTIKAKIEKVWELWITPKHIVKWNKASDDWHTPTAENDFRIGGKFVFHMEAKDKSFGFDFSGEYTKIEPYRKINYTLDDGRKVEVLFNAIGDTTFISEVFEAEGSNSTELQKSGWQAILNNFKKYAETAGMPKRLNFEIEINAKVDRVYSIMLDENGYREWTSEFNPGSHYKGSWEKGSKILFIGVDPDGNTGGMVSRIKEHIPMEFVSIEHIGILHNDKEITSGQEVESWSGALENYTFIQHGSSTLLKIDMDANEEFESYFMESWPKALNKLKSICEQ